MFKTLQHTFTVEGKQCIQGRIFRSSKIKEQSTFYAFEKIDACWTSLLQIFVFTGNFTDITQPVEHHWQGSLSLDCSHGQEFFLQAQQDKVWPRGHPKCREQSWPCRPSAQQSGFSDFPLPILKKLCKTEWKITCSGRRSCEFTCTCNMDSGGSQPQV